MIESARVVSAVTPILVLGDSNTIAFDNLLFECPAFFAQPFVTRSAYCGALAAATFTDAAGALDPLVTQSLIRHLFALGDDDSWCATHVALASRSYHKEFREIIHGLNSWKVPANDHIGARVIVIMVGTLDLEAVLRTLPAGCDFACEDERYALAAFPEKPVGPYVPAALVNELVAKRVAPLSRGLAFLRDAEFDNVYVHSIHPPTLEDYKYTKSRLLSTQASLRYKTALALNAGLRAACERNGARFLDMWAATTKDGVLDRRFEFDGDHLNRAAAYLSVRAVITDLAARVLPKRLDLRDLGGPELAV